MAGGIIAFSSGTAATAERQKPNNGRFKDDVSKGNLANLPDRVKNLTQRLTSMAAEKKVTAEVNEVLAHYAHHTDNDFLLNMLSRMIKLVEADGFARNDMVEIGKKLMDQCPAGADSVPKILADLKQELGGRFYYLSASDIIRIVGRSMRASATLCPNEIHRKMTELTIRGEFDHIPQMQQLRMEKAAAEQPAMIDGPAVCTVATQASSMQMEFRAVQAVPDYSFTSLAEKQVMPKLMEFKTQQMQGTNRLRSMPLAETLIVREALLRAPRTAVQLQRREPVLRAREEQGVPLKAPAEPQAGILKAVAFVQHARQQLPKEPALSKAQKTRPVSIDAQQRVENKEERLPSRQKINQLRTEARPAAVKKFGKKVLNPISRMRELVRAAKNRIAARRAEAKKRKEMKSATAKKKVRTSAIEKRIARKKEKGVPAAAIAKKKAKIVLPSRLGMKKRTGKEHVAEARKKTAPQAHVPAMFRRALRLRRGRSRAGFLRFLIAPGFFSSRRQRKNSPTRGRNAF